MINGSFDFVGVNYYTTTYVGYLPKNDYEPASYFTDACVYLTGEYKSNFLDQLIDILELLDANVDPYSYIL